MYQGEEIHNADSGVVDLFCSQQKYSIAHEWINCYHLSSSLHIVSTLFAYVECLTLLLACPIVLLRTGRYGTVL